MKERESQDEFFKRADESAAFGRFCLDVFGMNIAQDGIADKAQIEYMLNYVHFNANDRALHVGCGNGRIAKYIAETTKARVTGIDCSEQAIANARKNSKGGVPTDFRTVSPEDLSVPAGEYSAIFMIDCLSSGDDCQEKLELLWSRLKEGGRIGIFHSEYVREPRYQKRKLELHETRIARTIRANGWNSKAVDFCDQHYALALRKDAARERYRDSLAAEGNEFLYRKIGENEIQATMPKKEFERHATRYLYCIYK